MQGGFRNAKIKVELVDIPRQISQFKLAKS